MQFNAGVGHVKLTLSGLPFLDVTRRPAVAQLIHDHGVWADAGLQLETLSEPTYQIEIRPPSHDDILHAVLRGVTRSVTRSQPGRLAESVLRSTDDPTIYANRGIHAVIGALTTLRSRTLVSELAAQLPATVDTATIESIARRMGAAARRVDLPLTAIASKTGGKLSETGRAVDRLVRAGSVARGWRTECDRCGLRTFVPLAVTRADAACGGCAEPASYASEAKSGEPVLHYQLNALVDRASDQGVLCHLFAWACILQRIPALAHALLGANIEWPDGAANELDLVGFMDTQMFAGEAKMTAASFTEQQVARDVELSARLGVDVHVIACLQSLPNALVVFATETAKRRGLKLLGDRAGIA